MQTATKGANMAREIRAKYSKGKFEPLEDVDDLEEGTEVIVSVQEKPFSKEELTELMEYGAKKAKETGITSEEQVNEMIYEQRHTEA